MFKQNQAAACNQFDPFSYFGAIDMPVIDSEDMPAHPKISRIFKSQSQRDLEDMLRR